MGQISREDRLGW